MNEKLRKTLFITTVVVLVILGIFYLPLTQYHLTTILTVNGNLHPAKTIVVLGGGLEADGSLGKGTHERLNYAVHLLKLGFGEYLILSGGDKAGGKIEAEVMYEVALNEGIPPEVLIKEPYSLNTYENALYTKKILSYDNERKIILVTSPYHMQRATLCFEKQGIEVISAPVKNSEIYTYGLYQNFRNMMLLLHEFVALAWYYYSGWI